MAFLFGDTFDFYASTADLASRWTIGSYAPSFVSGTNTSFNSGQALVASDAGGSTLTMQTSFATTGGLSGHEPTIFMSFRLKALTGISAGQQFHLTLLNIASPQVDLQFTGDGTIVARAGGVGSPPLMSPVSAFQINIWDSWQVKVVISTTVGSVEVRKNGASVPLISLTNVNTQADVSQASANGLQIYNNTSSSTPFWLLDDLYVNSANDGAPTSWPGDMRGTVVVPNGAVLTGFAASPSGSNYLRVADSTTDPDASFVEAATVGVEDLYSVSATTAQSIVGVNVFANVKRTDSGPKTAGIQVKVGATDSSVLTLIPSLSYTWQTIYLATDPTGAAWTPSSVAGMNLGVKVVA